MKINEVEGLVNSGLTPEVIYKKLKEFYRWIKESENIVNPDLLNTHKELLWTIKSKIWIE